MELCLHHSVQYTSRVGAAAESIFLLIFGLFSFFLILASRISSLQTQEWNEPDTENEKTAVPDVISGFNGTFPFVFLYRCSSTQIPSSCFTTLVASPVERHW